MASTEVHAPYLVGQHSTSDSKSGDDYYLERPVPDGSRDRSDHRIPCDLTEGFGAQDKNWTLAALFVAYIWIEHHASKIPAIGDIGLSHG